MLPDIKQWCLSVSAGMSHSVVAISGQIVVDVAAVPTESVLIGGILFGDDVMLIGDMIDVL